ncbi:TraM recognition domain-containing protein [Leptolyngbya sp. CCY15150]|uniref:type IV secretory system conjugative DNA transfer family protein n=1 Tax=Leptolyngbya sp. CCY15150 TaxID=2767772 RepID=UPI00194F422F|nr:TraM recognition domain-containing protein [Leptolyngbya sp. CCY15150]
MLLANVWTEPWVEAWQVIKDILGSPRGMLLLGLILVIYLLSLLAPSRQHLTSGRFAQRGDKLKASRQAYQQLNRGDADEVVLWCGSPPDALHNGLMAGLATAVTGQPPTVYVPDANRSAVVIGKAGSGKTFSVIDPMVASAIEQGHPILLYDYKADAYGKGGQISYLATLAARHQYNVQVFAPGRPYSCIINPLDFLQDANDSTTAGVLAEVFHRNLTRGGGKADAFFGPAGQRLIQALIQFAKSTQYPDLAMAFCVVQLPNLVQRLSYAAQQERLPYFVQVNFAQFISTGSSEKTASGILATASDVLTRFMAPDLLQSLLGTTNVSAILERKELLAFQSDIFRQDVINPLLAAIINVVVNLNCSVQRQAPFIFSADEFPTIYMPQAPNWPNQHRSKGFTGIFGFQSFPQIVETYGQEQAKALLSACSTRFWFNPGDVQTAQRYSDELGETEVTFRTHSYSRSRGDDWGRNRSTSEQVRTKKLMTPDEVMRFGVGECLYINPAFNQYPIHYEQVPIPKRDRRLKKDCEGLWETIRDRMIRREHSRRPNLDMEDQIRIRLKEADRLLPMPPEEGEDAPPPQKRSAQTINLPEF